MALSVAACVAGTAAAAKALGFDPRFRDAPSQFARATPRPIESQRIAMIVADGFNAVEGFYPLFHLRAASTEVVVVGARAGEDDAGRGRYVVRAGRQAPLF